MNVNNKRILLMIVMVFLCFLFGCRSSEFELNYKQFKESYLIATDFVDKDNDSLKALKVMDVNVVETELKKMKELMDKMNTELDSKDKKGVFGNVGKYYRGLEFLLYAAKNYDKLSIEEKQDVYTESILASMNRNEIKKNGV